MSGINGVFRPLDISGSALTAQRFRMEVISSNLAYSDIDSRSGWTPYKRREVSFQAVLDESIGSSSNAVPYLGVRAKVEVDNSQGQRIPAPNGAKYGDGPGIYPDNTIEKSNVDVSQEMVRLLEASKNYEANIAAVKAFREMVNRALSIGR